MLAFDVQCHKQLLSDLMKEKALDEIIKSEEAELEKSNSPTTWKQPIKPHTSQPE